MHSVHNEDNVRTMSEPCYFKDRLDLPLSLEPEEYAFHEAITGLQLGSSEPETSLRNHLHQFQAEAFRIHPYPCVRRWNFARFKVKRNALAYEDLLAECKRDRSAIFLDAGCCMGTDVRSVVVDGLPADQILAIDLDERFIELGYRLFRDSPTASKTPSFLTGDLFSDSFLDEAALPSSSAPPALSSLTCLTPLIQQLRFIHCGSLFHLFSRPIQVQLARKLIGLLRPASGSKIFGSQLGRPKAGPRDAVQVGDTWVENEAPSEDTPWSYSCESWEELWVEVGREKNLKINVTSIMEDRVSSEAIPAIDDRFGHHLLVWCVTVL